MPRFERQDEFMVVQQMTSEGLVHEIQVLLGQQQATATSRPLVLMPGSFASTQTGRWPLYGGDAAGMDCLRLVGGSPFSLGSTPLLDGDPLAILIDDAAFDQAFEVIWSFIEQVDIRGLYLGGGGDLFSGLYGQSLMSRTGEPELWRDLWERYLLFFAWVLRWPTLGMCRGGQHMNVALGGGLIQDLRTQWRSLWSPYANEFEMLPLLRHSSLVKIPTPDTMCTHPLLVDPKSLLAALVQPGFATLTQSTLQIEAALSLHHQAIGFVLPDNRIVGHVAAGCRVSSIAHDGVIEALEATDDRFWLALQFHAEWSQDSAWAQGIFAGFVQACRDYTSLSHAQLRALKPAMSAWIRAHDRAIFGWSTFQGQKMPAHAADPMRLGGTVHVSATDLAASIAPALGRQGERSNGHRRRSE